MDKNSAKIVLVLFKYCEMYSSLNDKKYFFKKLLFNYIQGIFYVYVTFNNENKKEIKELLKLFQKH